MCDCVQTLESLALHWQGFDLPSWLFLAAREAGRYLHLPPVRAHGWEAHCLHPGSQEPEEDGCWGPLRWVSLRNSLALPCWGHPLWGRAVGSPLWQSLGKPPEPPHAFEAAQGLPGGEGRQAQDMSLTFEKDTLNLVPLVQAG